MAERLDISGLLPDLRADRRSKILIMGALVWLVLTCALAAWWMVYGLNQIDNLKALAEGASRGSDVATLASDQFLMSLSRQHTMLLTEGLVFICLLIGGGAAIVWGVRKETLSALRFREFFAAFSHDLKTALASLRLQSEVIEDALSQTESTDQSLLRPVGRLKRDVGRIQAQLENALFVATTEESAVQPVVVPAKMDDLKEWVHRFGEQIQVELVRSSLSDQPIAIEKAELEMIFANIVFNSLKHGKATHIAIEIIGDRSPISGSAERFLTICFRDDGRGFSGETKRLGEKFYRPTKESGSGLGLYLIRKVVQSRGGSFQVLLPETTGFCVELSLPSYGLRK